MNETPRQPEVIEESTEVSFLKDLPPHLTPRKKKVSFYPPEDAMIRDYSDTRTHEDYSTDPSPIHTRRVHTTIAAKHVGSSPRTTEQALHVGRGHLHDSIMGPQYFHGSSPPVPPWHEATEIPQETNAPEIRTTDEPIWIDDLPGSQDSEQGSDDNRDNRHQPPFGDPNDPDDSDDGQPPGQPPGQDPPGGGPPQGPPGNPNPWIPCLPGGGPPQPGGPPQGPPPPGPPPPPLPAPVNNQGTNNEFKFDKRIKISDIPMWDGNSEMILEWLDKLNHIAYRSHVIFTDLGTIAPLRLTAATEQWFRALPAHIQHHIQQDWGEFKLTLSTYFMNQQWFDRMKGKVLCTHY